jgi:hypothetical protein
MSLWTTKLVTHFIYTHFGVTYCRERARQWLHALGFRWRRLRHRHLKAKPEEQATFVTELTTLWQDWPPERELVCVEEATIRRHPTLTAQWCLADAVPEGPTGDDHTKGHLYGGVAPLTGRTHYRLGHVLGKEELATCLRQLLRYYPNKALLVIHDRAEPHQGRPVEAVEPAAPGRLLLTPQPAYSPELYPAERIWKWMRRVVTHNHWFATLPEEMQAIRDFFCYLAGRKEPVRQLCGLKIPESLLASL